MNFRNTLNQARAKHLRVKDSYSSCYRFYFGASPDALTASVRGQDADRIEDPDRVKTCVRKRQHLVPGFG